MKDLGLQQVNPLRDRHFQYFAGRQVGELLPRTVDRCQLLLLVHLVGHVTNGGARFERSATYFGDGRNVHLKIAFVLRP